MNDRYECRPALIVMAMRLAEGQEPDVRAELAAGTTIPEDRLDFAASEIGQMLEPLRAVIGVLSMVVAMGDADDKEAALRECVEQSLGSCIWTDDDKRGLTVKGYAEGSGEGEEPLFTVQTKLKKP